MRSLIAIVVLLSGCGAVSPEMELDQCKRAELFERCLQMAPVGPTHAKYNDWAEVVDECASSAQYHAYRHPSQITPECRSGW
jgi:hypothetical protein